MQVPSLKFASQLRLALVDVLKYFVNIVVSENRTGPVLMVPVKLGRTERTRF